jgi:hypothetical protein
MRWITSLAGIIETLNKVFLLGILLIVGTVFGTGLVQSWRAKNHHITLASFTDTSALTGAEIRGELGHVITDILEFELRRIAQFHTPTNPWGNPQEVPLLAMTGPQSINRVEGTISVAGLTLPLAEVVEALQPWFTRPASHYQITGSLRRFPADHTPQGQASRGSPAAEGCHRFPAGESPGVRIIIRLVEDGRLLRHWTVRSRLSSPATDDVELSTHLSTCLRDVAYAIMWTVLEGVEAESFDTFKHFIEGVDLFRQYKQSQGKNLEVFQRAETVLAKAIAKHPAYARAHFYLGNLYSWRAYLYEDLGSDTEKWYEAAARKKYADVETGYTYKPDEASALSHFGKGLVDFRHYKKIKTPTPWQDQEAYKDLVAAHTAFTVALQYAPEFYFAQTGRAQIYQEIAASLQAPGEQQGQRDCLTHARTAWLAAKKTAASLKDKDSVKWITKQMGKLTHQKERLPSGAGRTSLAVTPCTTLSRLRT